MLYMPVINLLSEWFVQRRGLAGGIIFAGSGVGGMLHEPWYLPFPYVYYQCLGFAFPLMVNALLGKVGFRWTLRIWSLGSAVLAGLAILGINHRTPAPKFRRGQRRPRFIPPQMHFLKRGVFWTFVCAQITSFL